MLRGRTLAACGCATGGASLPLGIREVEHLYSFKIEILIPARFHGAQNVRRDNIAVGDRSTHRRSASRCIQGQGFPFWPHLCKACSSMFGSRTEMQSTMTYHDNRGIYFQHCNPLHLSAMARIPLLQSMRNFPLFNSISKCLPSLIH